MPAPLAVDDYITAVTAAATRLTEAVRALPDDRGVPTCPDWTVRQLLAHQGMVHRWAAGIVRGILTASNSEAAARGFEQEGNQTSDPCGWLQAGAQDLVRALTDAPDDLQRFFFLNDAPAPKIAWARRQCHETTIHAVDGLSAQLGALPSAADADLDIHVAADGIDELVRGFATRGTRAATSGDPRSVVIAPVDVDRSWTVRLTGEGIRCDVGTTVPSPDARWSGTAAELYLGLWNRGDEVHQDGAALLGLWRDRMHVEWS